MIDRLREWGTRRPALLALLIQLLAAALALGLHALLRAMGWLLPVPALASLQALLALGASVWLGQPRWWWALQLLFVPGLLLCSRLDLSPGWLLGGFAVLALLNWNSFGERVPLYLTGRGTERQLHRLLDELPAGFALVDLGCGLAGTLRRLARAYPRARFVGVETAPLVFAIAWLRCLGLRNCRVHYRSLWQEPLGDYDAVYCFLSPAPMPRLWRKARAEMRPGSLLISNSFAIPGVPPQGEIALNDWRDSRLLLWRL